ncbi:MAG TPA: hypothetical protein VHF58_06070, partial [Solirubrobacterales bacterium]|nr:hypothetical protein [Solirubrobacterales bacterium]
VEDLRAGTLRVLHDRSFVDDPTRALRGARYAARLGLEVEGQTRALLETVDLATVSDERVEAELRKLAAEARPRPAFELAAEWGLLELGPGAGDLIDAVTELLGVEPWAELAGRVDAVLAARRGPPDGASALAAATPASPSQAVEAAHGHDGVDLVLARALGGDWLDRYVDEWRHVRLEISGADLLEAGVAQGPAVGRGLQAALRAKLDGGVSSADEELRLALDAAHAS